MFSFGVRHTRTGRLVRLVLAGLCLLLAAASAVSARRAGHAAAGVPVVVAARDLPPGRLLSAADVRLARWPRALAPGGARTDVRSVIGRRLAGALAAREPVGTNRLLGRDLTEGLPEGTMAVPVTVAGARTADLVRVGDRVELIATPAADLDVPGGTAPSPRVTVVAEHALVLAVLPPRTPSSDAADGTDLVVATDRAAALRIAGRGGGQTLAVVGESP